MKNLLVSVPDEHKPGVCFDGSGAALCPFAPRGCWARVPQNCPLVGAPTLTEAIEADKQAEKDATKSAAAWLEEQSKKEREGK